MSLKSQMLLLAVIATVLAVETFAAQWFRASFRWAAHRTTWAWVCGCLLAGLLQYGNVVLQRRWPNLRARIHQPSLGSAIVSALVSLLILGFFVVWAGLEGKPKYMSFVWSAVFGQAIWPSIIHPSESSQRTSG